MTKARALSADTATIAQFVEVLFRHADDAGFVSLRSFDQRDHTKPPTRIEGIALAKGVGHVTSRAASAATIAATATKPTVFAPPIATFVRPDKAAAGDLLNGLVLSVEIDAVDPREATRQLEAILGSATLIVASGSTWADPTTGELIDNRHLHWRLNEPTRAATDHADLARARKLAALLVGADPTGAPPTHPYRWPGSWNTKAEPVIARTIECREDRELDLADAIDRLEDAVEAAGLTMQAVPGGTGASRPPAELTVLAAAVAAIPNPDLHYDEWVRVGYAVCGATGGSAEGYRLWHDFSAKSAKHTDIETDAVWLRIRNAKPNRIGAGTIFFHARQHGWKAKAATASPPPPPAQPPPDDDWFAALDREFAVLAVGGKAVVMREQIDHSMGYPRRAQVFLRRSDFKLLMENQRLHTEDEAGKPITYKKADLWLTAPGRRTYRGLGLYPPPLATPDGHYNLWHGWGLDPAAGDWRLLRDHIERVLAAGDAANAAYLMRWIAWGLQHPAEKLEVAVLLIGGQRGGKGTLGNLLCRVYGTHGIYLHKKEQVVGRYNGHLANALFAFVDEAFLGGDEVAAGVLKSLITEPSIPIEQKFLDIFPVANRLRLLFASNHDHALHLDPDDQRVATFETVPAWQDEAGRREYFGRLHAEIGAGGDAAFLHDMLALDLTGFDPRDIPGTAIRIQQKTLSLTGTARWWFHLLTEGEVPWAMDQQQQFGNWSNGEITKATVYHNFATWAHQQRDLLHVEAPAQFWRQLRKVVIFRLTQKHDGRRAVVFPPLAVARTQFESFVGGQGTVRWGDPP